MSEKRTDDFTARYLDCGLKLSEGQLMREKFVLASAPPPQRARPLSAGENFLADILADPEKAAACRPFFPEILNLPIAEDRESPAPTIFPWLPSPPDAPEKIFDPLDEPDAALDAESRILLNDFQARVAALMAGAAVSGAARLDRSLVYSHGWDGRPIRFTDSDSFDLDGPELNLPERADRVWMLGFVRSPEIMGMNPGLARLRPPGGWLDWPGQIGAVLKLAAGLRAGGYLALPSAGGLVMPDQFGALAGLGELGRQGLLISPEYGPNLRLFSLITNYPLIPDRPLVFGVADYCETCQRCINECPAKALTEGHRRPGWHQWPVKHRACFDNWLEKKDPCRKCIEVCPYTREPLVGSPGGAHRPPPQQ